jgi:hypothetical protein
MPNLERRTGLVVAAYSPCDRDPLHFGTMSALAYLLLTIVT